MKKHKLAFIIILFTAVFLHAVISFYYLNINPIFWHQDGRFMYSCLISITVFLVISWIFMNEK